jgi:tetratricopeptide (TPR) repeat protein
MNRRFIHFAFVGFIVLDVVVLGVYWLMQRRFSAAQTEPAAAAMNAAENISAEQLVAEGFACKRQRQYPEAVAAFQKAIRAQPDHTDAHHGLAQVQREMGDLAAALRNHDRAIEWTRAATTCIGSAA